MTLLVVGGSGYLGSEVCRQAVAAGETVVATYARSAAPVDGVRWSPLDVRDRAAVGELVTRVRPRLVVNTSYRYDEWAVTATGAAHVAYASVAVGARLVHLSSDAVHGGRPEAYTERDEPSPIFAYGAAKAAAETAVRVVDPGAAVVRCSLIVGPDDRSNQVRMCLEAARPGAQGRLFEDEIRNPVGVFDLAAAVLELAAGDVAGVLNVAGPEALSRAELGRLVADAHGLDPSAIRVGRSADSGRVRPTRVELDTTLARQLLKTRIRPVTEALRR